MKEGFRSVREDFAAEVDSDSVRPLAKRILSDVDNRGVAKCWGAAALHEYVLEEVEYDEGVGPNFNRSPRQAAKKGGNCVDLSILLVSLFKCIDLDCRLTTISGSSDRYHMLPEVFFPVEDVKRVTDSLKDYYTEDGMIAAFNFCFFESEDRTGYWFIADPSGSSYLGDVRGLVDGGYVGKDDSFLVKERVEV